MKRITDHPAYQSLNVSIHDSLQRQPYTQRAISHSPYIQQQQQTPPQMLVNTVMINQNENQYIMQNMNKQMGYLTVGHENARDVGYNSPIRVTSQKGSKAS